MIPVLFGFGYHAVDEHYAYGHKNGMLDAKSDIFRKLDPYIDVIGDDYKSIVSIDVKAHSLYVVKDHDKYVIKKSR